MEQYGQILLVAMPAFLLLVLFEKWYGWKKGKDTVRNMDMISSLTSGITNVTKDVLGLSLVIISYPFLLKWLAIFSIPNTILVYIIAFVTLDFAGYWTHRVQHIVNLFWNGHIVHHSSEDFNLACSLRQSISSVANIFIVFLIPAAVFGVPAEVINIVAPLHLFAQFWYHTQHIHRMGFLEKIIVTPSHHRVHHAFNKEYIDKNFGQIFIFWDKLFGTYQQELTAVPPVYGITRPVQTWNPIKINFQHVWLLAKDAWRTNNWKDKFTLWFKPTGYRPADVVEKYPVYKIDDVYHFDKYETKTSTVFNAWCWFQLLMVLAFVSYLFGNIALIKNINTALIFWYGVFVFVTIFSLTDLMDRSRTAWIAELIKFVLSVYFLVTQKDWFGAAHFSGMSKYFVGVYILLSLAGTIYFIIKHQKEDALQRVQMSFNPSS